MAPRAFLLTALAALASAFLDCRPNGPVVPRPTDLSNSPVVTDALSDLTNALQQAVDGEINAGFPVENSSFSLAVVSTTQEVPGVPLWEFHHLSPKNVNGTKDVGRDSQYLIGSISKVFSDLVLLKSGVDPDTPAKEHLPSLENGRIDWDQITLRDLGSHQAGIPPNRRFARLQPLNPISNTPQTPALPNTITSRKSSNRLASRPLRTRSTRPAVSLPSMATATKKASAPSFLALTGLIKCSPF